MITKHHQPENPCGIVYELLSEECNAKCIGDTERALSKWLKEHLIVFVVGYQFVHNKHQLTKDDTNILDWAMSMWGHPDRSNVTILKLGYR